MKRKNFFLKSCLYLLLIIFTYINIKYTIMTWDFDKIPILSIACDFTLSMRFRSNEEILNFEEQHIGRIISILKKIMSLYVTYRSQSLSCGQPIGEGERDRHPVFFARSNRVWTLRNSPDFLNCEYVGSNTDVCSDSCICRWIFTTAC